MNTLIVDDDFLSRLIIQKILATYGSCHMAVNGKEAVEAVRLALDSSDPYDLICLDIMMPEMNGQQALKEIRALERAKAARQKAKIIMTTALADAENVVKALQGECDYFLVKPIRRSALLEVLCKIGTAV